MLLRATDVVGRVPGALAVIMGADHVVAELGPAAARCPGLTPGRPLRECLPPADADALADTLDELHAGAEATVVGACGIDIGCDPLHDAAGTVIGVLLHVLEERPGIEQGLARGAALQRLAADLAQTGTYAEIGELVVTAGARLFEADSASVYRLPPGSDTLELVHARGWPAGTVEQYSRIALQRGRPLSDSVLDGAPVWLENEGQWRARYPDVAAIGTSIGQQATACLPLRAAQGVVGAVTLSFVAPQSFSPASREFLLGVTALCTQAFERVRLLEAEQAARADAQRQLRWVTFLAETGPLLEQAQLSVEQRLQRLADLAVTQVADWCAVHLVRNDNVDQVAVAHTDPTKVAFVADLEKRYPPDPDNPSGAIQVARSGDTVHVPVISDEMLVQVAQDPEHLELLRSIGMRSAVVVPLTVRGTSIGALTLVHAESRRSFDETDLAFVQQLAAGAAVALDNARLYEQQRAVANTLQHALLPETLPDAPGPRLAARYRPYGLDPAGVIVGGDLYDVVEGAPGRWALTIADVCGKGPSAAALTAMIRHTLRTEVRHGLGPVEVLQRLNDAMMRDAGPDVARFATVVHAHIAAGPHGAEIGLVNAGHVAPLVLSDAGVTTVGAAGSLLGVFPDVELTCVQLRLDPGEALVLYTDGFPEARNQGEFYKDDRVVEVLSSCRGWPADAIADAMIADVTAFDHGHSRDDMAVLVVQAAT